MGESFEFEDVILIIFEGEDICEGVDPFFVDEGLDLFFSESVDIEDIFSCGVGEVFDELVWA